MVEKTKTDSQPVSTSVLRRRIVHVSIAGTVAAAVLVGGAMMVPALSRLADAQHKELTHSAQLAAHSIGETIKRLKTFAQLNANKVQANRFLILQNLGQLDATTMRKSTEALLHHVVAENMDVLGLTRFDTGRRVVAVVGEKIPESMWPDDAFSSDGIMVGDVQEMDGQVNFSISTPIIDARYGRIGTDITMLRSESIMLPLRPSATALDQRAYLAIPKQYGVAFLSPSGFVTSGEITTINQGFFIAHEFVHHAGLEVGIAPVGASRWTVLVTMDSAKVFRHVWEDVAKILVLALVVTLVVGFAVYGLMTPLAKGLVIRAETLEAEVAQRTKELNESEERFRGFAEAASDWFWETDSEHRINYVSEAFDVFGSVSEHFLSEQVLGKTQWEVPDARPEIGSWSDHQAQLDARQPIVDYGYEIRGQDGEKRTVRINARPVFSEDGEFLGYRGVGRDITELRRAQREHERAERLFLEAIASVPVAIALFDPDDRIVVWNILYSTEITKGVDLAVGMTFEEIVRIALARGRVAEAKEQEEQWLDRRLKQHREPEGVFDVHLDGAYLEIREHRTRDGYTIFIAHDVTRQKQAEADLKGQKDLLQAIIEHIPHAIYWKDRRSVYLGANRRFAETFGYSTDEKIVGKTIYDLFSSQDEADQITAIDRFVVETGEAKIDYEDYRTLDDGSVRVHLSSKVPLTGPDGEITGVLGIFSDITERKSMERRLEESEARIRALFESVPVGIAVIDAASQTILEVNPITSEMVGLPSDQIAGSPCRRLICSSDRSICPAVTGEGCGDGSEHQLCRADGTQTPILKTVRRVTLDGRECLLESFLDISEVKKAQEMVRKAQKLESLGNLAAGLAHELNNLLLPIVALSNMTLNKLPDDASERAKIEKIAEAADRAAAIIAQVTEFGAADEAELEPLDLHPVIEGALDLLRSELPPSLIVNRQLSDDTGPVMANSGQISALIAKLVANSVDAMDGGPGELTISLSTVSLSRQLQIGAAELPAGRYALLDVTDTGRGMSPETVERAFDPFFTTKEVGEGTGLGLSMVYGIVERQGGAIEISSEIGKGTKVSVYLPVLAEAAAVREEPVVSNG